MQKHWQLLVVVFLLGAGVGWIGGRGFDFGATRSDQRSKSPVSRFDDAYFEERLKQLIPPKPEDAEVDPGQDWNGPAGGMKPCHFRSKICFLLAEENR